MACTGPAPDERPVLIPVPQKTIWGDGTYRLPERLQLGIADTALIAAAGYVNEVLAPYGTVAVDRCDRGDIVLELDSAALPPEGYRLSVTHAGVRIGAVPTGASSMASPRCGSCCQRKPEAERRFLMRRSPIGRRSDGAA